ncbi:N-6 DNA methylase [Thiorhodococcus mannitoliphagus]|uniref:N-6 DNA methylase n=1 Tax=Thiorhodococcus mannitoliphagus TaxID=329406 RepID=UPI00197E26AC|nr:N-6 DNA methylase [Thiorhodococcus mannitoliphagus]
MSVRTTVKSIQDILRQDVGVDGDAQRLSQLCWMFFLKIIVDQDQELELLREGYRSPIPARLQWRNWAADPEGLTGEDLLGFINDDLFPALKGLPALGATANRARVVRAVFEDAYNYMKSGQLMRQVINRISAVDFNDLASRRHFGDIYEQLLNDLQSAGNAGEYYTPRAITAFMAERIDPQPGEILLDPSTPIGFPKSTGTAAPSLRSQAILAWFARAGSPGYIKPIGGEQRLQTLCQHRHQSAVLREG